MTKKLSVVALTLLAAVLLTTNVFAANNCSGGTNPVFIGVGSSAQTNTLAYAATNITTGGTFSGYEIWTNKSAQLQDTRFSTAVVDKGLTLWVVWVDNASNPLVCDVYAYFQEDSTVGVRDFFAFQKSTASGNGCTTCVGQYGAVFGVPGTLTGAGGNVIPGLTDQAALPLAIQTLLTTSPAPTSKTQLAATYCGQQGAASSKTNYCFFNAGGTDIRPEDALFATARALSAYNTTNGLTGLGYAQTACGAVSSNEGCAFTDSFFQGKVFFALNFALSGKDPVTGATLPTYQTLSDGLAPEVVFVNNADTASLGLGSTYTDHNGGSHYVFTDINRKVLANIFDGTTECSGAILAGNPASKNNVYDNGFTAGPPPGAGQPLQVVVREALSGTYNTFEYTAVRVQLGSANTPIAESKVSATTWLTNNDSGQDLDINPANNFGAAGCTSGTNLAGNTNKGPDGSTVCGDPAFIPLPSHANTSNLHPSKACVGSGQVVPVKLRGVGSGNLVSGTLGAFNSATTVPSTGAVGFKVEDGIGYAFWSYGNFAAAATSGSTPGHYLTVDAVDPLFITEGGEFDSSYGQLNNPAGAFNLPQCNFKALPCQQINFPNIYNGKYPLWSQLRIVTFNKSGTTQVVPAGVINMIGYAEIEATDATTKISDIVPLLNNIKGLPYTQGGTLPTGDLNVGIFRVHYLQSKINPNNGHHACGGVYTGIQIGGTGTCLADAGGDMGGEVLTIEKDTVFNTDFGSLFNSGAYEIYGLHQ